VQTKLSSTESPWRARRLWAPIQVTAQYPRVTPQHPARGDVSYSPPTPQAAREPLPRNGSSAWRGNTAPERKEEPHRNTAQQTVHQDRNDQLNRMLNWNRHSGPVPWKQKIRKKIGHHRLVLPREMALHDQVKRKKNSGQTETRHKRK
jgi:hypothetical protein